MVRAHMAVRIAVRTADSEAIPPIIPLKRGDCRCSWQSSRLFRPGSCSAGSHPGVVFGACVVSVCPCGSLGLGIRP